jgi:tRNA G18 (ribose-2'-O)-methylase SpoU
MNERWSLWQRNVIDRFKNMPDEEIKKELQRTAHPVAVCMEQWQGDFNISTLIRNANAFNVEKVFYFGRKRYDRRGTVGTHNYTDIQFLDGGYDQLETLKDQYTFVGIDNNVSQKTFKLGEFDWNMLSKPPLMIFGEEGTGLTQQAIQMCHILVEIPQYGSVRSLNVGTSSGVLLYDYVRHLRNSTNQHIEPIKRYDESDNAQNESYQLTLL